MYLKDAKKPSNDVFVQTCLGKTKPHSCLGFQESTNAQWLISVDLTSQRLKSCFHMPRDRSVRSHLDDWHQGHRSQSGPVQVKSRRIQSTRTGTPMCCNASTCLQHATGPRVKNPPAVYVILNHVPQENWDSHLGFLNISALGSHKQIGLIFINLRRGSAPSSFTEKFIASPGKLARRMHGLDDPETLCSISNV